VPTELPNNNSSIQFVVLADDGLALVFNESSAADATARRTSLYDEIDDDGLADTPPPTPQCDPDSGPPADATSAERTAFWGAPRAPMTLALSHDGGVSWPLRRNIEVGDGYCLSNNSRDGLNREYSYPSITAADGVLHTAFTRFRQAIEYVEITGPWIEAGGS
jgi:predicted neuraminidase